MGVVVPCPPSGWLNGAADQCVIRCCIVLLEAWVAQVDVVIVVFSHGLSQDLLEQRRGPPIPAICPAQPLFGQS